MVDKRKRRRVEQVLLSVPDFQVDLSQLPPEDSLLMSNETVDKDIPEELKHVAAQNYHCFRTSYKRVSPQLGGNFMVRMPLGTDPINLQAIHESIAAVIRSCHPFGVRLNVSFSLFLENEEEENPQDRFMFHYASSNNHLIFNTAQFITCLKDAEELIDKITYESISDHLDLARKTTKVRILHVASILINALILPDATQFSGLESEPIPLHLRTRNLYIPPLTNAFCLFYCLANFFFKNRHFYKAKEMAEYFCRFTKKRFQDFNGTVSIDDFPDVEEAFEIKLAVFDLNAPAPTTLTSTADLIYLSTEGNSEDKWLYLNSYKGHLCLIHDFRSYMAEYRCRKCYKTFKRLDNLKRHIKLTEDSECLIPRPFYKGGLGFRPSKTLEDDLRLVGIPVPQGGLQFDLFGTWDIESLLVEAIATHSKHTQVMGRHSVVCIAVCSNIPDYENPKILVNFESEQTLVNDFMDYVREMSEACYKIYLHRFGYILQRLESYLKDSTGFGIHERQVEQVRDRFQKTCRLLRIYGCWSSSFDVPSCLNLLLRYHHDRNEPSPSVVKAGSKFILYEDSFISLRDIASIQSSSLDSFLNCWGKKESGQKLIFPFDLMKNKEFLQYQGEFPSRHQFSSQLKCGELPSQEIYKRSKEVYDSLCNQRMDKYFRSYVTADVQPLVGAIGNMIRYFRNHFNISFLTDSLTISALSITALFKSISPKSTVILGLSRQYQDLNKKIREQVIGGFSASLHKIEISGMTRSWGTVESPIHYQLKGYDANSLYAGMLSGDLGTGFPTEWRLENEHFVKQRPPNTESSHMEMEYVLYTEFITSSSVVHAFNGGQVTFGHRNFQPDLWIPEQRRVDLFNGCFVHRHWENDKSCSLKPNNPPIVTEEIKKRMEKDVEALEYYKSQGLFVNQVFECEWRIRRKEDPQVQQFLQDYILLPFYNQKKIHKDIMLQHVMEESIFGLVEYSASIEPRLVKWYKENLPPFFQRAKVDVSSLGPIQQEQCKKAGFKNARVQLIAATKTQSNTLSSTELFVFLAQLPGFFLETFTTVYQFKKARPFAPFIEKLVRMRQDADSDPKLAPLGQASKLVANSSYGRTLIDQSRFSTIQYLREADVRKTGILSDPWLKTAAPLAQSGFWEVSKNKKRFNASACPIVGKMVLDASKKELLSFNYWMLSIFNSEKRLIKTLIIDTDSCYFSFPQGELESIVPEKERERFLKERSRYFVMDDSQKRTPKLWKLEKSSSCIISLSPKLYYCYDITTMEELKETKEALESLGLYAGPPDIKDLAWVIKEDSKTKTAMKGVPASNQRTFKSQDFLRSFLSGTPAYCKIWSIRRAPTTREVVTLSQRRAALSHCSFKMYQTSVSNLEALF